MKRLSINLAIAVVVVAGFWVVYKLSDETEPFEGSATLSDLLHQAPLIHAPGYKPSELRLATEDILTAAGGKRLLINFWASWCEACKEEKRFLRPLIQDQLGEAGFAVGVASFDSTKKLQESGLLEHAPYPVLLDEDGSVAAYFGIEALPQTLLFDERGSIIHRVRGPIDAGQAKILMAKMSSRESAPDQEPTRLDDSDVARSVPHFKLTDAAGGSFQSFDRLEDKVWVANFVFTRCQSMCPVLTKKMRILQREFADRKDLALVSISVDPAHDTPKRLTEYQSSYEVDPRQWSFLTGEWDAIRHLLKNGFRIGVPDKPIFHTEKFVLVDREMQVLGFYDVTTTSSWNQLLNDLRGKLSAPKS